jgi:tRNA-splicing ligase RtcB
MSLPPIIPKMWLAEPLSAEVQTSIHRMARAAGVEHIAVMPDVHLSHQVCVGLVIGTSDRIYPQAVGSDIGCGMAAVGFDSSADVLRDARHGASLLQSLYKTIPIIRHQKHRTAAPMPQHLATMELSTSALNRHRRDAEVEFATLGRGNHFLEFQADQEDRLWLMIHSGSRGIGQAIRDFHVRHAGGSDNDLVALTADEPAGLAYLHDMNWARQYAGASRRAMIDAVARLVHQRFAIDADEHSLIECDHNHVQRERHAGRDLWAHRKGATQAADGMPGVIPGSMGTCSFHTKGRGHPDSLCSSSHGAGRALSRTEARQRISASAVVQQMRGIWFDPRLASHLREEAPAAYKNVEQVMRAQRDLTRIVRRLRPLLVYKGG